MINFLLLIVAGIIIICGILLLVKPNVLIRVGSVMNKVVTVADTSILNRRWLWSVIFLLAGTYLFYVAFTN